MAKSIEELEKDSKRLDALGEYVRTHGGIMLHTGEWSGARAKYGGLAFGTSTIPRSLREALDSAFGLK